MKFKRNKTFDEFTSQSKAKQIFTPWFIAALVVCIFTATAAFTVLCLLNPGFEIARAAVDGNGELIEPIHVANIAKEKSFMSFVEYDPHANYQVLFKAIENFKTTYGNKAFADAINAIVKHDHQAISKLPKEFNEAVHAFMHSHSQGSINHNGTWGFAVKVLSGAQESWFYKFTNAFANLDSSVVDSHNNSLSKMAQTRMKMIDLYQDNYHAYYWIFITCMMPQMITLVIIIVKLITVLKPKLSAEQKYAIKQLKADKKAQKKNKLANNSHLNLEAH